jgi:phage terminase large subunit-like protein
MQYEKLINKIDTPGKYIFDEEKANRPTAFIEKFCKHSKGEWAGTAVKLELFQKAYLSALFGFVDSKTGFRQYKESLFFCARKNGKSTLLSGLALYMLMADGEPGGECYSIATKKDQAKIIFEEAHNMARQSPGLSRHIKKRKSDLYFPRTMGKLQALGKNSGTLDGLNAHLIIVDELHGIRDRNLYEVMKQSQGASRQPLFIMITTAGTVRECIFDDIYNYACNVAGGAFVDEGFLPVLYGLDAENEWQDKKSWQKANPGLGTIKKIESLEEKINKAQNSPNDLSGLLIKDFNIRGTNQKAWLTYSAINNESAFDLARFKNCYAIGGADLSITTDLSCATLLFLDKSTEIKYVEQMYWLPAENFESRVKLDKIPYDKWLARGLLRLCDGNCIKYGDITAWFLEMLNDFYIAPLWVYYDSYSARYWVEEMESHNFKMSRCSQTAKTLSLPMQMLGADLQAKKINYNNNPILKWCLSNTGAQYDRNGNIVPVKSQSAKQRIDGTSSLLDAYVGLMEHYNELLEA